MKIGLENSGQPRQPTSANFPTKKFVLVWQFSVEGAHITVASEQNKARAYH